MKHEIKRVWDQILIEVAGFVTKEPLLASFFYETILNHKTFADGLSFHLSNKLDSPNLKGIIIRELIQTAYASDPKLVEYAVKDLEAVYTRDPAAGAYAVPFLFFKGYIALQCYRVAHWLWSHDRKMLSYYFQNKMSELFAVDIHPAAKIGCGILIDHATSVVVGETAVIEDNVSILHEVTLGGTGKETGDRHPKVREGVLIGAGAKILGNIEIGRGAKIGAGSVVLKAVPAHVAVAGVPAKMIGRIDVDEPSLLMDHQLPLRDDVFYDFQI